jgi:hypothetical protein
LLDQVYQNYRGVAAKGAKFLEMEWNKADVGATPHPHRLELVELGLLSTAYLSGLGRRGARNAEQTGNQGIKSKEEAEAGHANDGENVSV